MVSRIYIVDDDQAVRQSLRALLELYDFKVEDFGSGEVFLNSYADDGQSCAVLDIHMPGLSGMDVLQHLRETDHSQLPVILMTGRDNRELRDQAGALGASCYLEKPVDIDRLLEVVAGLPDRLVTKA
jgi:FixJ family two-component response regulator